MPIAPAVAPSATVPAHSDPRNGELGPTRTDLINTLPGSGILLTRNGNNENLFPTHDLYLDQWFRVFRKKVAMVNRFVGPSENA